MKKILLFSLLFLSMLFQNTYAEVLTLENCIESALENNSAIVQEKLNIHTFELKVKQNQKDFSPEASISQGISYSHSTGKESYSTKLSLNHTLDDGGTRKNNLSAAELNIEKAREDLRNLINNTVFKISDLYYRILQKKQGIELQNSILERRKKDLILIRLKYQAGKESLQAVNESETSYKEGEYRKLKEERELGNIYFEINTQMGKPLSYRFDVNEDKIQFNQYNVENLIDISLKNRPELQKLFISRDISKISRKNVIASYRPKLSASMSESLSGSEPFKDDSFSASLSLSYKLYDGGKKDILLEDSENSLKIIEKSIDEMKDDITIETYNAFKNYELAYAKLQIDELTLKAKKDIYLLTKLKYEQGSETYFVFQNKENDLSQAEYNYVSSLYTLRNRLLTLKKVVGGKI